jgi:hypothetical protein
VCLGPAQVHPQQHLRPVLGLGATGAGLDVEKGVGGVHLAREHATELELADALLEAGQVGGDGTDGGRVVLVGRELQQIGGVVEPGVQLLDRDDDGLERGALAAEPLRALRVTPDVGVLELAQDLGQALLPVRVVKDTP